MESRVLYFGGKELNYKISVKFVQPNRQYFQNKKMKFGISRQISVFWIEVANIDLRTLVCSKSTSALPGGGRGPVLTEPGAA